MKKRSVFLSFLLVGSLLPGVSSASAPVASAGHGHDHGHAPFETHISEGLPKAKDFKDLKTAPPIERDVTTKVLDESGKQVGSRTFKANTGILFQQKQVQAVRRSLFMRSLMRSIVRNIVTGKHGLSASLSKQMSRLTVIMMWTLSYKQ